MPGRLPTRYQVSIPPVAKMISMATVATREKWRRIAPAKCRVSSPIVPTPINKMSAGRPPSQTLKASRCAMAAARVRRPKLQTRDRRRLPP